MRARAYIFKAFCPKQKTGSQMNRQAILLKGSSWGQTQKTTTDRYAALQRRYSFEHATLWKGARRVARVERGIERGTDL